MNFSFRPKTLTPIKQTKLLNDISVFDIETNAWLDETLDVDEKILNSYHDKPIIPFLLCYYDGSKNHVYDNNDCVKYFLKDFLVHKNRNKLCFSHNGGKFDMIALYQTFMKYPEFYEKFSCKPIMQGSRIMSFKIKDENKHSWEFRDSFSLLPRSLDYLCKSFKPDHIKLERPLTVYETDRENWIRYCLNDCYALYDILKQFNSIISDVRGNIGYTIASTSLATFRKRFLDIELNTYHNYNDFFRNAYYGGRTEIFNMHAKQYDGSYYVYDINSLYPFVMKNFEYPISKPIHTKYKDIDETFGKCGIADVRIITPPDLDIPILPYHRKDGKLLFPLGQWNGLYEYCLLEKAVKYGYDIKIKRAWEFTSTYLFKDFVDHFYGLKNNSSGAEKEIYKLILNSLYGKWGENPNRKELITDHDGSLEGLLPFDTKFGYVIREYKENSAYHLPAISIRVTAQAQLKLYSFIEKVKALGGTIYYCDTDSIITDVRLPTSHELGDIKLENEFMRGIFLAPKTYILELFDTDEYGNNKKIKTKGFTKQIKPHLNDFSLWEKALKYQDFTPFYEQKIRPASLNEIRIRHLQGFVTLVENKRIKTPYDKREVLGDFSTKPFTILDI